LARRRRLLPRAPPATPAARAATVGSGDGSSPRALHFPWSGAVVGRLPRSLQERRRRASQPPPVKQVPRNVSRGGEEEGSRQDAGGAE
jgi:hypothetical protein